MVKAASQLPRTAARSAPVEEPEIVLTWLVRLRWLAVGGQLAAVSAAVGLLGQELPLAPIAAVILATALSNLIIWYSTRRMSPPAALVPAVLILDVCLLTALLYLTGGPRNPFQSLYLIHVTMAVVVLRGVWPWLVVGWVAVCLAIEMTWHQPLSGPAFSPRVLAVAHWAAVVITAALIAYFIGRIRRSLRRHELKLAAVRDLANHNEQLATLTTLAAGAAHELGSPLATIAVVAKELELAASALPANAEAAEDARLIRREVDRCRGILDRMRVDILEDVQQKISRVRLEELIQQVAGDLNAAEQAKLQVKCDQDLKELDAPVRALKQAMGVLLRNAFDASPPDRPVTLGIHRTRAGRVIFEVEDQGCGMDEQVLRRAGQPFFTTKSPGKGMGLGLFLVRLVAQRYGGSFSLNSRPGEGTRSALELPAATAGSRT